MVAHLVHKDLDGGWRWWKLLERGRCIPLVQTLWNNLPLEKNGITRLKVWHRSERTATERSQLLHLHGFADHAPCSEV